MSAVFWNRRDVHDLSRFLPPQDAPTVGAIEYEYAQAQVLADVDDFVDHLGAACFGRSAVDSERTTRMESRMDDADDATLLHAALVAGLRDDGATAAHAMRILAQRHLNRNADRVHRLAAEAV